jgi:hypothetical protein
VLGRERPRRAATVDLPEPGTPDICMKRLAGGGMAFEGA